MYSDDCYTPALWFRQSRSWRTSCIMCLGLLPLISVTFFEEGEDKSAEKSLTPEVVMPLVVCYLEFTFFPPHDRSSLQYHLSVPVKAGQELPCRMQAAHPQCGTSLGIGSHMLTLPFPTGSIDVVRGRNLFCVFTCRICPGLSYISTVDCATEWMGRAFFAFFFNLWEGIGPNLYQLMQHKHKTYS